MTITAEEWDDFEYLYNIFIVDEGALTTEQRKFVDTLIEAKNLTVSDIYHRLSIKHKTENKIKQQNKKSKTNVSRRSHPQASRSRPIHDSTTHPQAARPIHDSMTHPQAARERPTHDSMTHPQAERPIHDSMYTLPKGCTQYTFTVKRGQNRHFKNCSPSPPLPSCAKKKKKKREWEFGKKNGNWGIGGGGSSPTLSDRPAVGG